MRLSLSWFFLIFIAACGLPSGSQTTVVGGQRSEYLPFMIGLSDTPNDHTICGGALIEERVVLTAAHCVLDTVNQLYVIAGSLKELGDNDYRIPVRSVVIHPGYADGDEGADIALLFLDEINVSSLARPIAPIDLALSQTLPNTFTIAGWGNRSSFGQAYADYLMSTEVENIPLAECNRLPEYEKINHKQICAGHLKTGGFDSCQGDSGGPLLAKNAKGQFELAGVVSWGIGCAQKSHPGVYTRVSAFKPWIDSEIKRMGSISNTNLAKELETLIPKVCYNSLTETISETKSGAEFTLWNKYVPQSPFSALNQSSSTLLHNVPGCSAQLFNGHKLEANVSRSGDTFFIETSDVDSKKTWRARAKLLRSVDFSCTDETWVNLFFENNSTSGYVAVEGESFDIVETRNPISTSDKLITQCDAGQNSIRFFKRGAMTILETKGKDLGEPIVYELEKSVEEGAVIIKLAVTTDDGKTGDLVFKNTSSNDLFTWFLSCNLKFSLTDRHGNVFEPKAENGRFWISALHTDYDSGMVRANSEMKLSFAANQSITEQPLALECKINDTSVDIE